MSHIFFGFAVKFLCFYAFIYCYKGNIMLVTFSLLLISYKGHSISPTEPETEISLIWISKFKEKFNAILGTFKFNIYNIQKYIIPRYQNHLLFVQQSQMDPKLEFWCAIQANGVSDPIYFDKESARGDNCYHMFNTFITSEAQKFRQRDLFQHNGALCHTIHDVRTLLNHLVPDSWIGTFGPQHLPTTCPDLMLPDFFSGGSTKHNMFDTSGHNIMPLT